jgi:PhnB protein
MNQLNAYLFFDGTCADAMRFYERTLGGKLDLITHAQSPSRERRRPAAPTESCTRDYSSTAAP